MSQPTNAAGKADTKRARADESAASVSTQPAESERSVRQRVAPAAAVSPLSAAASATAPSSAITPATLSFLCLAVVERQLIMQGLDITSLTRIASTCRQMRAEALHKEAVKFIPQPHPKSALAQQCSIHLDRPIHASPLFRAHVPVTLQLGGESDDDGEPVSLAMLEPLLVKASTFSCITTFRVGASEAGLWTEPRMLQLLAQPWMQSVEHVFVRVWSWPLPPPSPWLQIPRVQAALFALPCLTAMTLKIDPGCRLFKHAVQQARGLTVMELSADTEDPRSIRAVRAAPALTDLRLQHDTDAVFGPDPLRKCVWCLPPTLQVLHLELFGIYDDEAMPRPTLKALFQRTPLLHTFATSHMFVDPFLRGMLDAGVKALPMLRSVEMEELDTGVDPNVDPNVLRRFLHRFPQMHVCFALAAPDGWDMREWAGEFASMFGSWPRVEVLLWPPSPPAPHPSDDESGSDVESVEDPGSDAEDQQN